MKNKLVSLIVIVLIVIGCGSVQISAKPKIRTVKIKVSNNGYAPNSVTVKKGATVKLMFYRADANNCGDEVVFPKLNIKRELPVGKTVIVEISPEKTGKFDFTCGMGMYQGKLLVTN